MALLAVVAWLGLGHATTAYALKQNVADNIDAVTDWAYKGGTVDPSHPCGAVCSDLYLEEHRPMPNQPSTKQLYADLNRARSAAKVARIARAATVIGLGSIAVEYAIREGAKVFFGHVPADSGETGAWSNERLVGPVNEGTAYAHEVEAPEAGYFWAFTLNFSEQYYTDETCPSPSGARPPLPAAMIAMPMADTCTSMAFMPMAELLARLPSTDYDPTGENGYAGPFAETQTAPADPGTQAAQDDLVTFLESPQGSSLEAWLDMHLDEDGLDANGQPIEDPYTGEPAVILVPAPQSGETYTAYIERLVALGLVGQAEALTVETADLSKGSFEVVSTNPAVGTAVETGATITVRHNPDLGEEGGTDDWSAPAVRALDFSPLAELSSVTEKFPVGVFGWLLGALGSWQGTGGCPSFAVPFATADSELVVDFCDFEPAMEIIRPTIVVVACLCMVYMFAAAALGFGGKGDE